jgi:hypothetical protein
MTPGASVESDSLNWVGNETTDFGLYILAGTNHYEYGNNILGTVMPTGTTNLTDTSYYRTSFTGFFHSAPYPPTVGLPNVLDSGTIPAKQRFLHGGNRTVSPNPACVSSAIPVIKESNNAAIYPNPATNSFYIRYNSSTEATVEIFSVDGRLIYSNRLPLKSNLTEINTSGFSPGIYLVRLVNNSGTVVKKLVIEG